MTKTTFTKVVSENEIQLRAAKRMVEMMLNVSSNIPEYIRKSCGKRLEQLRKCRI